MPSSQATVGLDVGAVQAALRADGLDGWLLYDFRGLNPLAADVTGVGRQGGHLATRRWYYLIPATGEPRGLVHKIEKDSLAHLPGTSARYAGRDQLEAGLRTLLAGMKRIAMEYSPGCAIPYVARVDAGTIELVRQSGADVVSSGDLVQRFSTIWNADTIATHREASDKLYRVKDRAFAPERPTTVAAPEGDGFRLTGSKAVVQAGPDASLFLVPAETPDGVGVFLVEPGAEGLTVTTQTFSDLDTVARLDLDGVRVGADALVGAADGAAYARLRHLLLLAASAEQLGICEGALALTASYAKTREQFGRPIGTFQAVSQRLADGYIDTLGQRLTLWQAAWRLEEGLPADTEVAVAKLWAADAGHRIAHTTVHVHGGVGIDLDGEAHRYFTSAKRFEFLHGGATEQALNVGRALAAEPA